MEHKKKICHSLIASVIIYSSKLKAFDTSEGLYSGIYSKINFGKKLKHFHAGQHKFSPVTI